MAVAPNLTYTITCTKPSLDGGTTQTIPLSSNVRMSTATGYSTINVVYNTDISLSRYEAYVTKADDEYGVGVGKLVYYCYGALAANVNHAYTIAVNTENFYFGDTTYRISMYAQNAVDLTWDATTFLLTTTGNQIADSDGNLLEVYVQGSDNSIVERDSTENLSVTNLTSVTQSSSTLNVN